VNNISRLKTFALIAIIGFIVGVIAQLIANYITPRLNDALTSLSGFTQYLIAGIAGAIITLIVIIIWAYLTGNKNKNKY